MIKRVFVSLSCLAATLVAFNPEELAERLQGRGIGKIVAINAEKPVTDG